MTDRELLPRLLLLLEREASQPAWHRNGVLCVGVAPIWALGAAVPLSALLQFARVPSHIDYMSLDVEGYELAAIMSGARTLTMTPWP